MDGNQQVGVVGLCKGDAVAEADEGVVGAGHVDVVKPGRRQLGRKHLGKSQRDVLLLGARLPDRAKVDAAVAWIEHDDACLASAGAGAGTLGARAAAAVLAESR